MLQNYQHTHARNGTGHGDLYETVRTAKTHSSRESPAGGGHFSENCRIVSEKLTFLQNVPSKRDLFRWHAVSECITCWLCTTSIYRTISRLMSKMICAKNLGNLRACTVCHCQNKGTCWKTFGISFETCMRMYPRLDPSSHGLHALNLVMSGKHAPLFCASLWSCTCSAHYVPLTMRSKWSRSVWYHVTKKPENALRFLKHTVYIGKNLRGNPKSISLIKLRSRLFIGTHYINR